MKKPLIYLIAIMLCLSSAYALQVTDAVISDDPGFATGTFRITNDDTFDIYDIEITSDAPSQYNVSFDHGDTLDAGQQMTVTVHAKITDDLTLNAQKVGTITVEAKGNNNPSLSSPLGSFPSIILTTTLSEPAEGTEDHQTLCEWLNELKAQYQNQYVDAEDNDNKTVEDVYAMAESVYYISQIDILIEMFDCVDETDDALSDINTMGAVTINVCDDCENGETICAELYAAILAWQDEWPDTFDDLIGDLSSEVANLSAEFDAAYPDFEADTEDPVIMWDVYDQLDCPGDICAHIANEIDELNTLLENIIDSADDGDDVTEFENALDLILTWMDYADEFDCDDYTDLQDILQDRYDQLHVRMAAIDDLDTLDVLAEIKDIIEDFADDNGITLTLTPIDNDDDDTDDNDDDTDDNDDYTDDDNNDNNVVELTETSDLKLSRKSRIEISRVKVECSDQGQDSVDEGDTYDEVRPGSTCEITMYINNEFSGSSDIEINDIEVEAEGEDYVDSDDTEVDVDAGDRESITLELEIDDDVDDRVTEEVTIIASGYDDNNNYHEDVFVFNIKIEPKRHSLNIRNVAVTPSEITDCDSSTVKITARVENDGLRDEDETVIDIEVPSLSFNKKFSDVEIEEGEEKTFTVTVPVDDDTNPGTYTVKVSSYYDTTELSDYDTTSFKVKSCSTNSGTVKVASSGSKVSTTSKSLTPKVDTSLRDNLNAGTGSEQVSADSSGYGIALIIANIVVVALLGVLGYMLYKQYKGGRKDYY